MYERILLAANDDGGGTSGGGDFDGADAARTLNALTKAIELSDEKMYSLEEKEKLLKIAKGLKIVVTDRPLPARAAGEIQNGAAHSSWRNGTPVALLSRDRFKKIDDLIKRESLLHHELCVLGGLESTGDYHRTTKFEQYRTTNLRHREEKPQTCTISVFHSRTKPSGERFPGKAIGTASLVLEDMGARNGVEKIGDLTRDRDMKVLFVIGSAGYLRLMLVEADRTKEGVNYQNLKNQTVIIDEALLFDPYGDPLYSGTGTRQIVTQDYFVTVSCVR